MKDKYYRYAKLQIRQQALTKSLLKRFKNNGLNNLIEGVYIRTRELFIDNKDASKALMYHLNQILPCIAFYEALIKMTGSKDEALILFDEWAYDELYKMKTIIRKICRIGLYKMVPKLFDFFIDKLFGTDAGFKSDKVEGSKVFSRDILICPYNETCKKYGYPELTKYFCKSDDITYKEMHPKLIWNRTKTIGNGDKICDFRLHLVEDNR